MALAKNSDTAARKVGVSLTQKGYPTSYSSGSQPSLASLNNRNATSGVASARRTVGGSGSGSSSSSSSNLANAYNSLLAAYKANDYSDYYNQMRAAAQNAYDRGMSALNNAYDAQMNSLNSNLSETKNQLANQYNYSRGNINSDAADSLKQTYINRMLSERNLGQQMSAQGLSGGATETTLANMLNNYGNARNNITTQQNKSLADLEQNYGSNLSQAQQAYNSAVANANLQKAQQAISLENALANNQISALSDYQSLMQRENENYLSLLEKAIANGASFAYTPTQANNAVQGVAVQQAAPTTANSNYAALQALMNAQQTPGSGAAISLTNPVTNNNYLAALLAQLQGA